MVPLTKTTQWELQLGSGQNFGRIILAILLILISRHWSYLFYGILVMVVVFESIATHHLTQIQCYE